MRFVAQPQINTQPFAAVAASIGGWLSALLLWIVEVFDALPPHLRETPLFRAALTWAKAQAAADLRRTARVMRLLIAAHAFAQMQLTTRPARRSYPQSSARGVRGANARPYSIRRFIGSALAGLHCGSLKRRATRLQRALAALPKLVARVLQRMRAMWRTRREGALVLVAARDVCRSVAGPIAPMCADTS